MFDIGWSEMAVVLLVALIVIGPKDLPRVARTMGQWVGKGRAMAREFQRALEDMAREAELDKVKNEIEKAGRTDVGKTIEKTVDPSGELSQAFDPKAGGKTASSKTAGGKTAGGKTAGGKTASSKTAGDQRTNGDQPARARPLEDASAAATPNEPENRAHTGNGADQAEAPNEPERAAAPAEPS